MTTGVRNSSKHARHSHNATASTSLRLNSGIKVAAISLWMIEMIEYRDQIMGTHLAEIEKPEPPLFISCIV